jgi:hypothetical protein
MAEEGPLAFVILKVEGDEIVTERAFSKEKLVAEGLEDYRPYFVEVLRDAGEPRLSVIDWNRELVLVGWSPDAADKASKMLYASAAESLLRQVDGISRTIQATDDSELSKSVLKALIER